ncbi:MAG: penicillin-binding protein 1C [Hydrogenophaga sp.]|nr:penicillin-binding protein 1C [Hydrogenophaga sp.]
MALLLCLLKSFDLLFPLPAAAFQGAAAPGTLVVLAADGTPLRTWASTDGALRHPIQPEAVSPLYLEALRHYEDRWFDWHPGINPVAMLRALGQWAWHGRVVSGGSTLTMQVARILDMNDPARGPTPRTVGTKLRQMARALQLEWHLSKRDILTLYLNHAPMGGQVQGIEMASRAYLGKTAVRLSHAEAALLVALPQSPSRLRPDRAPGLAQAARDKVLTRMTTLGVWPAATVADARLERVFAPPLKARWLAPLAAERLRQAAKGKGPVVHSTLDAALQLRLEQVLLDRLIQLPPAVSVATLVVENDSLAVRGYAGSADFSDNQRSAHVDMVRGVRSPGSTLKPFLYAMALDEGLIHSESLLVDAPQSFGGYAPGNFQASFSGPVSVSEALQRSLNVPAVDLLERIGPARFAAHLRNAALKLRLPPGASPNLSLILGGGSTTLEELVGAYTALARAGVAGQPRLTPDAPTVDTRLMSAGAAFIVREILESGGRPGAPFKETGTRVAWKTGTSFGFRDAWAIGVTDRYTLGVWVGRPDGTPNPGFFGANTAAPLVKDLLAALDASASSTAPRALPASVRAQDICWPLGLAASATPPEHCRMRRLAWTLDGTAPPTMPDRLQPTGLLDTAWVQRPAGNTVNHRGKAAGGGTRPAVRLRPGCAAAAATDTAGAAQTAFGSGATKTGVAQAITYARWPTLLQPWIEPAQRSEVERLPWGAPCRGGTPARTLRISGLEPGSVLRAVPGTTGITVQLQALGTTEAVNWLLDGRLVGTTQPDAAQLRLLLQGPGQHALTAMDAAGQYQQVVFSVR